MSKRKLGWPIGGSSASVTSGSGCRVTDEILRRQVEEIRAEVARLAPHWAKYEQDRAAARDKRWRALPYESGSISSESKRRIADLKWKYIQENDVHLYPDEDDSPNRWQRFVNWLRNLFGL